MDKPPKSSFFPRTSYTNPSPQYTFLDSDASAFNSAIQSGGGSLNNVQKQAVDNLTISLKNNNLWSKMTAIYPFVGGSAISHSYNLKNPAQYQITWNGTVTHDQNGFQADGLTGYGNTNLNSDQVGLAQRIHGSICSRTNNLTGNPVEFGAITTNNGFYSGLIMHVKASDNNCYYGCHDSIINGRVLNQFPDTSGFFVINNQFRYQFWRSVTWSPELGIFCAVAQPTSGTTNHIMTSTNGINWTSRAAPVDNNWLAVCWSPELNLFCAVASSGTGNRVMTSPDGINWTARTSAANNTWPSVCWSPQLGLFCAVSNTGTGNRVMTSPDGINWTSRNTTGIDNTWQSVCWSPQLGLFCAVAGSGTGNRVMTSPDGINWTIRNSAADNGWRSVCWSPELNLFCAVASNGTGNRVMTSPDGINWTIRNSAADNFWSSVCWSPQLGLFCAVASSVVNPNNQVMTSPDGINWTIRTFTTSFSWQSVCWSPQLGIFCSVGSPATTTQGINGSSKRIVTSSDGINWITRTSPPNNLPTSNLKAFFRNGDRQTSSTLLTSFSPVATGIPIYIGARNRIDTPGTGFQIIECFSNRQYSFSSFGNQLTEDEIFIFNTVIQTFQMALSRQV